MATTSIPHRWKYDVFVSFRGEDIRKSFMDHMFNDFKQKGIHSFKDDNELPKGEEISPHLYKAIEESRFLIVIFSKNYASSTWCLRELVKILGCKEMGRPKQQEVQIIFYDVKPNMVRNQTDSYAQRLVSLTGLHMLTSLNFSYCNLEQVPDAIGGLSCLEDLDLGGNNFTSLPGSLSQLSSLKWLQVDGCKKLEVLPELPHSLYDLHASDCTSLCSITGSNPIMSIRSTYLNNCPKLFENLAIDSEVSISETECHDSSVTSQGSTNRFSSFLRYARIQNNRSGLFRLPGSSIENMDIYYQGNSIPNWFTNKSMGNHVKVELPSDWSFSKFRGYGICVVFKRKKHYTSFGYDVKNFDRASLGQCWPCFYRDYFEDKPIRIDESDMIWLHYSTSEIWGWRKAKNFLTFCFKENEGIEVKEMGVRVVCDEDLDEEADVSMFQDLPTLSEHGGAWCEFGEYGQIQWTW